MEQIRLTLEPLARSLPEGIGNYWLLMVCAMALVVLLPVAWQQRQLITVLVRRTPTAPLLQEPPTEDLSSYPAREGATPAGAAPPPPTGQRRLLFEGVPAQVRLVVLAPMGTATTIEESSAEELLNHAVWGLGSLVAQTKPNIRIWPPQLSAHGFAATFHRAVHSPDADGHPSHWILAAGPTPPRPRPVLLGLALWTEEPTTIGRVSMNSTQWINMLRLEAVEPREGMDSSTYPRGPATPEPDGGQPSEVRS